MLCYILLKQDTKLWIVFYEFLRNNLNNLKFGSRKFHPPADEGNAIISFVNTLLYSVIYSELYNTELDTSIGFLHEPCSRKPSLVLDIADIFKPLISSSILLKCDSLLSESDFEKKQKGIYLSHEGRKKVIELFQKKMEKVVFCKKLKKEVKIRTAIRAECLRLRDWIEFIQY
ncbi:MAG TPA: CRISPR-associated endonuclease Cas1 [Nanoarchaeota archaeon]|nr:CRISPR-associated endonuclease Cas1 [Nanoarchaeota archaeon]